MCAVAKRIIYLELYRAQPHLRRSANSNLEFLSFASALRQFCTVQERFLT